MVLVVPVFFDMAAEVDLDALFWNFLQPNFAARQPEVRQLGLPAIDQFLAEDAVFVTKGIAHCRIPLVDKPSRKHAAKRPNPPLPRPASGSFSYRLSSFSPISESALRKSSLDSEVEQIVFRERPIRNSMQR